MPPDKLRRKSSILKPPKVRNPLSDLDFKTASDDDGVTSDYTRSRRVSFSSKKGVALFTSDDGNTVWHNIYEEANKPDISDSSSIAGGNQTHASTEVDVYTEIQMQLNNDSLSSIPGNNHDLTFAVLASDANDEDDHCVNIGELLKSCDKLKDAKPINEKIVLDVTQQTFTDQTDALINYRINLDSSEIKNTQINSVNCSDNIHNEPKRVSCKGGNITAKQNKTVLYEHNDAEISITEAVPSTNNTAKVANKNNFDTGNIQCMMDIEGENADVIPLKNRFASCFNQYQQDCIISNKSKASKVHSSNLHDTDINDSCNQINTTKDKSTTEYVSLIGIIAESIRTHKIKKTINVSCPLSNLDSALKSDYSIPQNELNVAPPLTENNKERRQTIIFDQKDTECNMSMTIFKPDESNDNLPNKENENIHIIESRRKTIIFNQETPECDMSITNVNPQIFSSQELEKKTVMFNQDMPDCNMSLTDMIPPIVKKIDTNRKTILFKQEAPECVMSSTEFIPQIVTKTDAKRNIIIRNQEIPEYNKSMTDMISPIMDKIDSKRKTIVFDQGMPDCNMSMTGIIPSVVSKPDSKRKTIIFNQEMPDSNMSMTGMIPRIQEKAGSKRKTIVFDQETSECNMSMTGIIPVIAETALAKRKTILFDQETLECNMSMTGIIPSVVSKPDSKRKTIIFNQEMSDCNMSITGMIPRIQEKVDPKRKTIVFDQETPECNMSMTAIIPAITETDLAKRKTIVFDQEMPECNMSMTGIIPSVVSKPDSKRKTIIFNQEMSDCNMSMTGMIPHIQEKADYKRKTIVFDQETPEYNMSMTGIIPVIPETALAKRKTIVFDQETPECNMSMTGIIPSVVGKPDSQRKTIIFNQEMSDCNMSMTGMIPHIKEKADPKRKTIVFDQETPECNMSMTGIIPAITETVKSKRKTIVFDQEMPECNMSMTGIIPSVVGKPDSQRTTIIFNQEMPNSNMPMTSMIPQVPENDDSKRKTIMFDQETPECNMSMTGIIPAITEIAKPKRKTIVFDQEMPECNMSMTGMIPHIQEKADPKRKTIVFDQETPECNMSMTGIIPAITETAKPKRKTIVFDQEMPECNMSMTGIIPSVFNKQDSERKANIFNQEMPDCNMSMTGMISQVPEKTDSNRKTIVFDQKTPDCNMSMTGIIPAISEKAELERKTIVFDQEMPECNMSMTGIIPTLHKNAEPKRKTIVFEQKMPECNVSMSSIIPLIVSKPDSKRKSIVFNPSMIPPIVENAVSNGKTIGCDQETPQCNISMTDMIPPITETAVSKRKTIVFGQEMPECTMPMTGIIPSVVSKPDSKRKTIIFSQETPDSNMSLTVMIPQVKEKVDSERKTIGHDHETPEYNISMTDMIPPIEENADSKRKTIVYDQESSECDMSMTGINSAIPDKVKPKRQTIASHQEMLQCNVEMGLIKSAELNKSKIDISTTPDTKTDYHRCTESFKQNIDINKSTPSIVSEIEDANHIKSREIVTQDKENYASNNIDENSSIVFIKNAMHYQSKSNDSKSEDVTKEMNKRKKIHEEDFKRSPLKIIVSNPIYEHMNLNLRDTKNLEGVEEHSFHKVVEPIKVSDVTRVPEDFQKEVDEVNESRQYSAMEVDVTIPNTVEETEDQNGTHNYVPNINKSGCKITRQEAFEFEQHIETNISNPPFVAECPKIAYEDTIGIAALPYDTINTEPVILVDNASLCHSEESHSKLIYNGKNIPKLRSTSHDNSNFESTKHLILDSEKVLKMHSSTYRCKINETLEKSGNNVIKLDEFSEVNIGSNRLNKSKGDLFDLSSDVRRNPGLNLTENEVIDDCGQNICKDVTSRHEITNIPEDVQEAVSNKSIREADVSRKDLNLTKNKCHQNISVNENQTIDESVNHAAILINNSVASNSETPSEKICAFEVDNKSITPDNSPEDSFSSNLNRELQLHSEQNKTIADLEIHNDIKSRSANSIEEKQEIKCHLFSNVIDTRNDINFEETLVSNDKQQLLNVANNRIDSNMNFATCHQIENSSVQESSKRPIEIGEKRKSDGGVGYETAIDKKLKTSTMPVCSWLNDLNTDHMETSIVNKETNVSTRNINAPHKDNIISNSTICDIDTLTYDIPKYNSTLLPDKFERPKMDVSVCQNNVTISNFAMDVSSFKNIQNSDPVDFSMDVSNKSAENYVENISDLSLVNISIDILDPQRPGNVENSVNVSLLKMDSEEKLSTGKKSLNRSLLGSLCQSEYTILDPNNSHNSSMGLIFEPPPNLCNIIEQIGLDTEDCVPEDLKDDEWSFQLLWSTIRLTVRFGPPVPEYRNLERLVLTIMLEPIFKGQPSKLSHRFRQHASKVMLQQLNSEDLASLCQISGDLPNLMRHCAQVSRAARNWSSDLYVLYVNFGLEYLNDRFSFRIVNGIVRCIWQVDIKMSDLPFARAENISVRVLHGSSPIDNDAFISAVRSVQPDWLYLTNAVDQMHKLVKDYIVKNKTALT